VCNENDQEKKKEIEDKITNPEYLTGFELVIKRDGDDIRLSMKINNVEFSLTEEIIQRILED